MKSYSKTLKAPFILTNHPGRDKSPTWEKISWQPLFSFTMPVGIINDLYQALVLFLKRKDFQVVVLGGGARVDLFYLILQRLWPLHRKPVVKIDCLWYQSPPLKQLLKRSLFTWLDKAVSKYVVWASREIADYSRIFQLPAEKFRFIPYHMTIDLSRFPRGRGEHYIFSGGNFARDYATLAEAVRGLPVNVVIACSNSAALNGISFPDNVKVVGVNHEQFMNLMAASSINVVPLRQGLLHSGGQQTFLNAMALGKPVIVTDPEGARDYIEDGVDGLLVPAGDPLQLRQAILQLLNDRQFADIMGRRASLRARRHDTEAHLSAIARLAKDVALNVEGATTACIIGATNNLQRKTTL